jgi:hypothetical protein
MRKQTFLSLIVAAGLLSFPLLADEPPAAHDHAHMHMHENGSAAAAPAKTPEQIASDARADAILAEYQRTGTFPVASADVARATPTGVSRTFTVRARKFTYDISPLPFTVNEGDDVTINAIATDADHGLAMENYISFEDGNLPEGTPKTYHFIADVSGLFTFFCTNTSCGTGHSGMSGTFTVNAAPQSPAISSVSPASGRSSGGLTVLVSGTNFQSGAVVDFDGTNASSTTFNSSTAVSAVTPAHAAGTVTVTVRNSDGGAGSKTGAYTFVDPPAVTGPLSPSSGSVTGGTVVTITGTGFQSGATVTFGGSAATNVAVTSTSITATTPAHSSGAASVVITNPDGQSTTVANAFTFVPPVMLHLTAIAPNSGSINGGTTVTLTGSGFASGGVTVTIGGGVAQNLTVVNDTTITAQTVAHYRGPVDVVVSGSGSTATLTSGFIYTEIAIDPLPHKNKRREAKKN